MKSSGKRENCFETYFCMVIIIIYVNKIIPQLAIVPDFMCIEILVSLCLVFFLMYVKFLKFSIMFTPRQKKRRWDRVVDSSHRQMICGNPLAMDLLFFYLVLLCQTYTLDNLLYMMGIMCRYALVIDHCDEVSVGIGNGRGRDVIVQV